MVTLLPCRRGHPRTADNIRTYLRSDGGLRFVCKSCVRITTGAWKRDAYLHNPAYRKNQKLRALTYYNTHYRGQPKRTANVPT